MLGSLDPKKLASIFIFIWYWEKCRDWIDMSHHHILGVFLYYFNGRWPQNIIRWITQQPLIESSSILEQGTKPKMLEINTTSNWRWPQHIKSWTYQQPLIGSFWNFKIHVRRPNQNLEYLKWRQPQHNNG
jgi:hypothetical protein